MLAKKKGLIERAAPTGPAFWVTHFGNRGVARIELIQYLLRWHEMGKDELTALASYELIAVDQVVVMDLAGTADQTDRARRVIH